MSPIRVSAGYPISIHALLAESDPTCADRAVLHLHFYPRSPCGERPAPPKQPTPPPYFYPRSPCGERPSTQEVSNNARKFLSTLSLRRATVEMRNALDDIKFLSTLSLRRATIFAVRPYDAPIFLSTLSLRRATQKRWAGVSQRKFLSTLSLRRATAHIYQWQAAGTHFYPRSPCGERPPGPVVTHRAAIYFYPRSPCGERHHIPKTHGRAFAISIHALLAESDRGQNQ